MNFNNEAKNSSTSKTINLKPVEIVPEYIALQIVKLFKYLQIKMVTLSKKDSIRGLWTSLTNIPMPKAVGTQLRSELDELGFEGSANGNIPIFKDIGKYKGVIYYGIFNDDCSDYNIPEFDENDMNQTELNMYKEVREPFLALSKNDSWKQKLAEFGLAPIKIFTENNITIIGEPLSNLEALKLDIPEITDFLPENASLIRYSGTAYFYVTTPCAMEIAYKNRKYMSFDMPPVFYQTFDGGIAPKAENEDMATYPPCEDTHYAGFFTQHDEDRCLEIQTSEAYVYLVKKGVYQKYYQLDTLGRYDFFIMRGYLIHDYDISAEDVKLDLTYHLFPLLDSIKDIETLEFIKQDLIATVCVRVDDFITSEIDSKIAAL